MVRVSERRKKKRKRNIEGECYFCKQELRSIEKTEKVLLTCCNLVAHKQELYKWFLQNQHCPSCLAVHKQDRSKIVQWGMNKEKPASKHAKPKLLIDSQKGKRKHEKRLRGR